MKPEDYYTIAQLAELLGYANKRSVTNLISQGRFPIYTFTIPHRGTKIRVATKVAYERYLENLAGAETQRARQDRIQARVSEIMEREELQAAIKDAQRVKRQLEEIALREAQELRKRRIR